MTSAITLSTLRAMKKRGEKFATLTAYDASFSSILEGAGIEVILVGDSLGMVIQGNSTTVPVTIDETIYHTRCVRQGSRNTLLIADMPFMSDATPELALANAARLMKEGGAQVVKLEGGAVIVDTVRLMGERGIPVCGHLGLLPQSINKLGSYRVQGRDEVSAKRLMEDALLLESAGAELLVLECVPAALAKEVAERLTIPVIGIGAGADCDSQVLVLYDLLGITPGKRPSFSKNFLAGAESIEAAIAEYARQVKSGEFPAAEQIIA